MFKFPKLDEVARNALAAHFENRLQATTSASLLSMDSHYYKDGLCCVLGASMPPDLAMSLDTRRHSSITILAEEGLVQLPEDLRQYQYLQRLHDQIVAARAYTCPDPATIAGKTHQLLTKLKSLAERKS